MELSKSQKKIARQLISKALQRECKTFLEEVKDVLPLRDQTPHEVYLNLYKKITDFDKHIATQYDRLSGSRYFMAVFSLFYNNVLTEDDIKLFNEEVQQNLMVMKQNWDLDSPGNQSH